jgi:hypothetical protein
MGFIGQKDIDTLHCRQRARPYQVGDVTGDHRFTFESKLRVLNQWILLWKTFEVLQKWS